MYLPRLRSALILLAGTLGLGACGYNDGYGYSRVSVGYSSGGYCDPYYGCRRSRYRSSYYDPWYGWYGDYYYPGIGFYVYDRWGSRHRCNDNHRRFWENRRSHWRGRDWNDRRWENWGGYRRDRGDRGGWDGRRDGRRDGDRRWRRN